jgi:hypothetical protein
VGLVVGLLVVGLFLLFAWMFGAFDQQEAASGPGTGGPDPSQSPDESTSTPPPGDDTQRAQAMEGFVDDYIAAAVEDPKTSWELLTPEFQAASKSFGEYKKYWDQWESAVPSDITADPSTMTVNYDITYVGKKDERSDNVTLTLEESGDSFLIAAEG